MSPKVSAFIENGKPMITRSVAIAGSGIGGLAVGLALLRRGWQVHIYEQSDEMRILGASIYIWENGLRVLEALGVFERVVANAVRVKVRERRDTHGELFGIENTSSSGRLYLRLRWALLTALRDGILDGGGKISFGMPAVGADPAGILNFADGSTARADLVIGADGINSRVRHSLGMLRWRKQAIMNAVNDAIHPLGASINEVPMTPLRILKALRRL
jgi:2-polyprenyl-6-methoxyphenol hydroxylase-like FAD-dependent oxidoreductase